MAFTVLTCLNEVRFFFPHSPSQKTIEVWILVKPPWSTSVLRKPLCPRHRLRPRLHQFAREDLILLSVKLQVILYKTGSLAFCLMVKAGPANRPRRRFKSSRLIGEFEKPWLDDNKKRPNWDSIIFYTCACIALGKHNKLYQINWVLKNFQSCLRLYMLVCVCRSSQTRSESLIHVNVSSC